jgi:hypothetical protein
MVGDFSLLAAVATTVAAAVSHLVHFRLPTVRISVEYIHDFWCQATHRQLTETAVGYLMVRI